MRLKGLLIHRCTMVKTGQVVGQDDYGRDIIKDVEIKDVPCRVDRIRERASTDEQGTDYLFNHIMYLAKDVDLQLAARFKDIKDKEGNQVIPGSFYIESFLPIYNRIKLHHYEVTLKREWS